MTKLAEPLFQSAEMGALPTLRAATDPGVIGGQYFGPDGFGEQRGYPKVVASSRASHDTDAQRRLWTVSEELTGVTFPVPAWSECGGAGRSLGGRLPFRLPFRNPLLQLPEAGLDAVPQIFADGLT